MVCVCVCVSVCVCMYVWEMRTICLISRPRPSYFFADPGAQGHRNRTLWILVRHAILLTESRSLTTE